jgi:hypothetical protein
MTTNDPRITMPPSKGRSFRWGRWFAAASIAAIVALLLLPRVVGTQWVYGPLLKRLEARGLRLQIDDARLSWFRSIKFNGIELFDPQQQTLASFESVETDRSLLGLLWSGGDFGGLNLNGVKINLTLLEQGTNLQQTLEGIAGKGVAGQAGAADEKKSFPKMDLDVRIHDLIVEVRRGHEDQPLFRSSDATIVAHYQALDGAAVLELEPATLLEHVRLEPELMGYGLGLVLPVLAKATALDGSVSLQLQTFRLPLEEPKRGAVAGTLMIESLEASIQEPLVRELVGDLAMLLKRNLPTRVRFIQQSAIDFAMEDGRMHHDQLAFGLPELDSNLVVRTAGSVGLDRTLDLQVAIPIPLERLARRDSVKLLGTPSITIPVRGTLDEPKADWSSSKGELSQLLGMISMQVRDEAPGLGTLLQGLEEATDGDGQLDLPDVATVVDAIRKRREAKRAAQQSAAQQSAAASSADASNPETATESSASDDPDVPERPRLLDRILRRRQR